MFAASLFLRYAFAGKKSMMHKDNRHLEILTVKDVVEAGESLRMLMGTDVEGRREFLFENVDFSKLNG